MTKQNGSWILAGAVGLALGLVIGYAAAPDSRPPNPMERNLDASLWQQTSGEYRACCLQAYRQGQQRLREKLKDLPKEGEGKPPAVVMDLDETVLDNSGYQTWLIRSGRLYTDESWKVWESEHFKDVELVPGAGEFIAAAEQAGVTVIYISNRFEENRAFTVKTLQNLRLDTKGIDRRLLLTTGLSDKTARRKQAERDHRVLLLFGDNLRDFDETFKAAKVGADDLAGQTRASAERLKKVDEHRRRWGDDWIILPNPTYGEWPKLVGSQPVDNLRPTTMKEP
jgi:acid phosphatase